MTKKRHFAKRTKALIAVVIFVLMVALAVYVHGVQRIDPQALDKLIEQELARGSDQRQVLAFLDSNHISHSEYMPDVHIIYCEITKSRWGLMNHNIHITFNFDEYGKLMRHKLEDLPTWP